jgi:tRNA(Ile)-lysidine synthase
MEAERVLEQARAGGLLPAGAPVVVLLSGGRDSVCLLDVAARLVGSAAGAVAAVHVNYGLRDDVGEDERHCAALCERLGVALSIERPRRPETAHNLQAWARDVRYAAAARLALARGAAVAVGHNADDQVETILYRLASSPSRRALLGMRARDGRLVRPLLGCTRAQTTAYCEERGLPWRDDSTNAGHAYARNRLRHALMPALEAIHPAAAANVLRTAELLRDEAEVLDALVEAQLGEAAGASSRTIELEALTALPPALRRLVVQRLADGVAGRPVPGAARRADAVAALRRAGTAALDLGGGVRAVAEYGLLRAERVREAAAPPDPVALPVPGVVAFGGWEIRCEPDAALAQPAEGVLDRAALADELLVRPWRAGDRMAPVGLGGTKSLQDLFTARRVPRARRGTLPVVLCGEEIAWVPGVATSARFGVTATTRAAVRLSATALA